MKTYFIFHDDWYQYIKADYMASMFPFDGFVVVAVNATGASTCENAPGARVS